MIEHEVVPDPCDYEQLRFETPASGAPLEM